jgi:hypothetical protein
VTPAPAASHVACDSEAVTRTRKRSTVTVTAGPPAAVNHRSPMTQVPSPLRLHARAAGGRPAARAGPGFRLGVRRTGRTAQATRLKCDFSSAASGHARPGGGLAGPGPALDSATPSRRPVCRARLSRLRQLPVLTDSESLAAEPGRLSWPGPDPGRLRPRARS